MHLLSLLGFGFKKMSLLEKISGEKEIEQSEEVKKAVKKAAYYEKIGFEA